MHWRVEAFPDASQANWEAFLRALQGTPQHVVRHNHHGLNGAVRAAFPRPSLPSASGTYATRWRSYGEDPPER